MSDTAVDRRQLRALRVYHSAVVTAWRRRNAALRDEGVMATVVSPARWNEGGADVDLVAGPSESIEKVPTVGRHPFLFWYRPLSLLLALRRHRRVDVIDIHEEPAAIATIETLVLARLAGCRAPAVCYSAQNLLKRYPPPFRWIERWVLSRVTAVHSCNDDVAAVLRTKGFRGTVENLGLGIDTVRFAPSDGAREAAPTEFHIGYVGRFTGQKGIFTLVAALASLDGIEATFVGAGPEEARLRAAIRQRGLERRVRIQGFAAHDELPDVYRSFDALVVPSLDRPTWKEQFGRVAVEAMACGTPVIVSDGGALREVAAGAGLVVPQGDAKELVRAIERVRDEPSLRAGLRERGIRRAEDFSWGRVAAKQAALYRRVAGGARRRSNRSPVSGTRDRQSSRATRGPGQNRRIRRLWRRAPSTLVGA